MRSRREIGAFAAFLAVCVGVFFHETLIGGKILSPADVLLASASFRDEAMGDYEPANRLLMDPVLQFQPWLEFNRTMIRSGRLPLWNSFAGCGTPHLANGQSAVFDPFHLLAYLGTIPRAYAWIAAGRLWMAGLGMFLLARSWKLGIWGCWFAGLTFPFCGFLVLWLLFPVTGVAIWMPWLFLVIDRVFSAPGGRSAGWLAIVVALVVFGGHIQTSAHVLLAGGLYALARSLWGGVRGTHSKIAFGTWTLGTCLGLGLAAVQILPLGFYLAKSTVWSARKTERPAWWVIDRPRLLDAVCVAAPYVYGSQRQGHPNLARALGVHNLNESAGGYTGLATLIWLAPLAVLVCGREPRVVFLTGLVAFGAAGAFRWPPVDNLLRALPVLDVTDHRRLTLWVAFGLTLLGGVGVDHLGRSRRLPGGWLVAWGVGSFLFASVACVIPCFERQLRSRADSHYRQAALATPGANAADYHTRAERQARQMVTFLPRYHALVAGELALLAALAACARRATISLVWIRVVLIGLTLFDLAVLGLDLNPAISAETHSVEPPVITRLRQKLPPFGRAIGIGEELPPNVLMRFGLADPRNYDSIELASNATWFKELYEPAGNALTSRSEITWNGTVRARDRLIDAGVGAIVAGSPPPEGAFDAVERVDRVWIAWLPAKPWADSDSGDAWLIVVREPGRAQILVDAQAPITLSIRETWDAGWKATLDGHWVEIQGKSPGFLKLKVQTGQHEVLLNYNPIEVRVGAGVTLCSLVILILVLTENRLFRIPGSSTAMGLDGPRSSG